MGRKALPNSVKVARGTLQKCRTSEEIQMGVVEKVKVPKWLNADAKKIFKEKTSILINYRVLTELDIDQLAIYASKMAEIIECEISLREQGKFNTVFNDEGKMVGFVENPYSKLMREDIKIVNTIGSNFGFSPASRKVLVDKMTGDKTVDEFTDFEEVDY